MKGYQNFDILNLKIVSKVAKVGYTKLYFRKTGRIEKELEEQDKTKVVNAIQKYLAPLFLRLGFTLTIARTED